MLHSIDIRIESRVLTLSAWMSYLMLALVHILLPDGVSVVLAPKVHTCRMSVE